jgi:chromosome segregation ATPase
MDRNKIVKANVAKIIFRRNNNMGDNIADVKKRLKSLEKLYSHVKDQLKRVTERLSNAYRDSEIRVHESQQQVILLQQQVRVLQEQLSETQQQLVNEQTAHDVTKIELQERMKTRPCHR